MNFLINSALTLASNQLKYFSRLNNFWQVFDTAFGTQYNRSVAEILRLQWEAGDFSQLPQIEVLDSSILGSANGAYASSKNKIYLSNTFVAAASLAAISGVLLEEIGHFVDAKINQTDSAGDEGAIFAALVQGQNLDVETLRVLKAEDDHSIVTLNGQKIKVENASDTTKPTITLAVSPSSVTEDGTTNLVYTFTRTGSTANALTVNYGITGTADSSDYTGATPGTGKTIAFAAGSSTRTLTIDPTADTTVENNETVILTLAAGSGYTVGTTSGVTGTITNDDVLPSITLAVSPSSVTEDGTTNLVYTFTRTGSTANALTVNYGITGTADSSDYTGATPGTGKTIAFAAGSSTRTLTIDPTADTTVENNETVILTLAAGSGYTVGTTTSVTGTITNDDIQDTKPPLATSLTPDDNATGVAVNANLVVNFDEAIQKGTGNIFIKKVSDNSIVETIAVTNSNVTISGNKLTINPTNDLASGTT